MIIGLSSNDRLIGQEIGGMLWQLLPDIYPEISYDPKDPAFNELWDTIPLLLRNQNSDNLEPVQYPVVYMGMERVFGTKKRAYEFPEFDNEALSFDDYLEKLRLFLIYRLTRPPEGAQDLLISAVWEVLHNHGTEAAIAFVQQLWRGRWLVDFHYVAEVLEFAIVGGIEEELSKFRSDRDRIASMALDIIMRERLAKEEAKSFDDWIFEAYSLLPEIFLCLRMIRQLGGEAGDELRKFDRVMDEFIADIMTTIFIMPDQRRTQGRGLADYLARAIEESQSFQDAKKRVRGVYRGRSIVPRIWYEKAASILDRIEGEGLPLSVKSLRESDITDLNASDISILFSYVMTADGKENQWMEMGTLFDLWETQEIPEDELSGMKFSISKQDTSD